MKRLVYLVLVGCSLFAATPQGRSFFLPDPREAASAPAKNEAVSGRVVSVADGDTITILTESKEQIRVRLAGIDAPEKAQAYGQKAKQALSALVFGKEIEVTSGGKDRYGRLIGWVRCRDLAVNRQMIADGWAWHYLQYDKTPELDALQAAARSAKRGLWADSATPIPPWEFRSSKRSKTK